MLKLKLPLLFSCCFLGANAQDTTAKFQLYLQRESDGVTEIIDTSFESKAALHEFLKGLPSAALNLKNRHLSRIYRNELDGDKRHPERGLLRIDSFPLEHHIYHFRAADCNVDSITSLFKIGIDSTLSIARGFSFGDSSATAFFRFRLPDDNRAAARAYRTEVLSGFEYKPKKAFELKILGEADKKMLTKDLDQKLTVSSPPLPLEELKVFPNPGDGLVQLSFRVKDTALLKIRVLNDAGQSIFSETVPAFSGLYLTEIDLRNAGKGVYYVYVLHGKKSAVRKLIIS